MRTRLVGLAAFLGLIVIAVGVPVVLAIVGPPLPTRVPSPQQIWAALTSPDDGTAIMYVFAGAVVLAWAYLVVAVLVEIVARLRRLPAPRLPGFSPGQAVARGLVGAAALLFAASPLFLTVTAHADPLPPQYGTSHQSTDKHVDTAPKATPSRHTPSSPQASQAGYVSHTVRAGESLSSIADHYLGDGGRWGEILAASQHLSQPGGQQLADPDQIDIGWTLHIPSHKASPTGNAGHPATKEKPASQDKKTADKPHTAKPDKPTTQPTAPPAEPTRPPAQAPPESTQDPTTPATDPAQPAQVDDHLDDNEQLPVRTIGGVGVILAAGVIGCVTVRRHRQQRLRRPGQRIAMPSALPPPPNNNSARPPTR